MKKAGELTRLGPFPDDPGSLGTGFPVISWVDDIGVVHYAVTAENPVLDYLTWTGLMTSPISVKPLMTPVTPSKSFKAAMASDLVRIGCPGPPDAVDDDEERVEVGGPVMSGSMP